MIKTILGIFAALAISFTLTVAGLSTTAHAQSTNTTSNTTNNSSNTTSNSTMNSTANSTTNSTSNTTVPSGAPKTGFQPK